MSKLSSLKYANDLPPKLLNVLGGAEVLIELAKNNIVPHYVLVNPLDKSEQYLFINNELTEWYENNSIFKRHGISELMPKFHSFHPISKTSNVPFELVCAKDLCELPLHLIDTPPGIYFLCWDNKIVYIGQAAHVAGRIFSHINEQRKLFNQVFYLPVPRDQLFIVETAMIRHFRPKYNVSAKPKEGSKLTADNEILDKYLIKT